MKNNTENNTNKNTQKSSQKKKNSSKLGRCLKWIIGIAGVVVLVVVGYLLYVLLTYSRIEDNQALVVDGNATEASALLQKEYTITSYNIGFGAYTPDFTFFMDGGKESRAKSAESVKACTNGALDLMEKYNPDLMLFQELDTDSTRSHHVNQYEIVMSRLNDFQGVFAQNYHSAYLIYPLTSPHGASNSGIATFSSIKVESALRRKLPISEDFSKLIDLDRCYSFSRIPVENGKELIIFNAHLSAYGADASIKEAQFSQLFSDMKAEYDKGNYVICGGDYNSDFVGDSNHILNGDKAKDMGWNKPFPDYLIPDGIRRCMDYQDGKILPTARDCDVPYEEGNFTIMVDGFLASDNVEVTYLENIQTGFAYSDHNPVCMRFMLK